ncbi:AAA family ATPase [Acinetobacter sp. 3657]|uniref:AAA family ATPase n=1 Tax=Acinetobacter sp. 3657 TaxID=2817764 RepID=UPI00285CC792|nr:broad-specificity NMP kinase [Prolinoborus sp. 3657]
MSDLQYKPSAKWVRYLRSYGPTPNNAIMFDEHVSKAARLAKIDPIKLPTPLLSSILDSIYRVAGGSIIIAGTAGDGKTYHCRALWQELGGTASEWNDSDTAVKCLDIVNYKKVYFVKDLSELNELDSNFIFELLEQSVLENETKHIVIIAANHGQILERLRKRSYRSFDIHPIREALEQVFLQTGEGLTRLDVFDLSRSSYRKSLTDVLDILITHPEWDKCKDCHFQNNKQGCPISENRQRLLGETDESRQLRSRLSDLVDIARLNGSHLPVRDLLALCSNILLGHSDVKDGLMRCNDIDKILNSGTFSKGNLYDNIFAKNLPNQRVAERPVFKALSSFQIGEETTSEIDGLLIYGRYDNELYSMYNHLIESDRQYGNTNYFKAIQESYLEGGEYLKGNINQDLIQSIESQRRRLFFTLPENLFSTNYFWNLSAYKYAAHYLELLDNLQNNHPISEEVRQLVVLGINRIMTGMLVDEVDNIIVATSGGFTQSKVSVLCKEEVSAHPPRRNRDGMLIKLNHNNKPYLEFYMLDDEVGVTFEMTPIRFEFLARVSYGILPTSFSSECLEDLLALKSKLLRRAEQIQSEFEDNSQVNNDEILLLRLVNDSFTHGSKNISVRLKK